MIVFLLELLLLEMIGLFWNVRGIWQDIKKRFVRDLILERKLDFIGLQETMKGSYKHSFLGR